jgi:hypothetical protein
LCEQLILQGYCLCVIDPEGDYATLESLPGVVVFGGEEPPPRLSDVARALRYPEVSIVIDLSAITHAEKLSYLDKLLPMLAALRRSIGLPHWIVVDEAHYFLHQPDLGQRVDFELAAYVLITYRPSQLHPELLRAVESIIVTPLTDAWEVRALTTLCGAQVMEAEWGNVLGGLGIDEAAVLPQEAGARRVPQPFTITERITLHVRHRAKYFEVPIGGAGVHLHLQRPAHRRAGTHVKRVCHDPGSAARRSDRRSRATRRLLTLDRRSFW